MRNIANLQLKPRITRALRHNTCLAQEPISTHSTTKCLVENYLGCLFLQESSGFLFFLLLWRFFHRNHDSCSAEIFLERHQETCLYGVYVESYVGYQFVRQKQSTIQFYGTLQWLLSTTIAAPPPPLLHRHCCAATTTATPIAAPPLPLPLLRHQSRCCAA